MSSSRLLLDTVFIPALLNRRDQYHDRAKAFLPQVRAAKELWVTAVALRQHPVLPSSWCSLRANDQIHCIKPLRDAFWEKHKLGLKYCHS